MELIAEKPSGQSKHDAISYVKKMGKFPFIIAAVMTQYVLAFIWPLSVALQSKICDLVQAFAECWLLLGLLQKERSQGSFNKLFWQGYTHPQGDLWSRGGANVSSLKCQGAPEALVQHPSCNTSSSTGCCYSTFLNQVVSHLKMKFHKEQENALLGYYCLPCDLTHFTEEKEKSIMEIYQMDLPMLDTLGIGFRAFSGAVGCMKHESSPCRDMVMANSELVNIVGSVVSDKRMGDTSTVFQTRLVLVAWGGIMYRNQQRSSSVQISTPSSPSS